MVRPIFGQNDQLYVNSGLKGLESFTQLVKVWEIFQEVVSETNKFRI